MEDTFTGFIAIVCLFFTSVTFHYLLSVQFPDFSLLPNGMWYDFLEGFVLWIATLASVSVFLLICNRVGQFIRKP